MVSERELLEAIDEIERNGNTLKNCEKLSALYSIYDHCFCDMPYNVRTASVEKISEAVIDTDIVSEFATAIQGKNSAKVWEIINEEMDAVRVLQPKLYESTINRLKGLTNQRL